MYVRVNTIGAPHPGFKNQISGEIVYTDGTRQSVRDTEAAVRAATVAMMQLQDTEDGIYTPLNRSLADRQAIYQSQL